MVVILSSLIVICIALSVLSFLQFTNNKVNKELIDCYQKIINEKNREILKQKKQLEESMTYQKIVKAAEIVKDIDNYIVVFSDDKDVYN